MLNLKDMFRLYELVGAYIPKEKPDDVLQFVSTIIDNMINAGQYSNYANAVLLTSGKTLDDIKNLPTTEIIRLFAQGLIDNKIIAFMDFLEKVNFND